MVAGPEVRQHLAALRRCRDWLRSEHVVQPPANIAPAHLAPRRPPGEEPGVVRVERAADVGQPGGEQRLEKLSLLGALADDPRLPLAWMHVEVAARDIDVTAEDELAPVLVHPPRPRPQALHEGELRRVVLAAVRHVDRGEDPIADRRLHDARLHVELGMAECRRGVERRLAHVQRYSGVGAQAVPEHMVVVELTLQRDLSELGFQLLQAHDVGPVLAREPFAELRLARPDAVDVPSADLHRTRDYSGSMPASFTIFAQRAVSAEM